MSGSAVSCDVENGNNWVMASVCGASVHFSVIVYCQAAKNLCRLALQKTKSITLFPFVHVNVGSPLLRAMSSSGCSRSFKISP